VELRGCKASATLEKYGTTENVTVTPEEVQTFIDQKEKESQG